MQLLRHKPLRQIAAALTVLISLTSCSNVQVEQYRNETPTFNMRQYFSGTLDGWGMFQDRAGKVIKRFTVTIDTRWEGAQGTLDERFTWSDGGASGNPARRVWRLQDMGNGHFVGRADDVIGEALGHASGNALRWRYVLALNVDGDIVNVDFDDWMYLVDDQVLLNRSVMSKYGVKLGEVTLTLKRRGLQQPQ